MSATLQRASNRQLMDKFFGTGPAAAVKTEEGDPKPGIKCYAVVRNIPAAMHSKELRAYFSFFTENGRVACFHYRHRPEVQTTSTSDAEAKKAATCCCVVSFENVATRSEFIKEYHGKHWTNSEGLSIPRRCFISAVKVVEDSAASGSDSMTTADVDSLVELKPPAVMPQGNVGTPSEYFMEQIRLCRLPSSIISKLGLKTGRRRRKFGEVAFNYAGTEENEDDFEDEDQNEDDSVEEDAQKEDPLLDPTDEWLKKNVVPDNDEGPDDDKDECEEWERHEAVYDDVTEQERTKPKKYEEEMEIVWEKGGPGLVWHMDKNYWDEREKGTDMDWKWADDWDVDYSVYYEGKSAGTLDGRHAVEMREDELKRAGKLDDTVFRQKQEPKRRKRRFSDSETERDFRSNYGSRLMEKMGWKPGSGLGRGEQGRVEPVAVQLHEDANSGREKSGLGYRGEKMQRTGFDKKPVYHSIATKYDVVTDNQRKESKRLIEGEATSEILFRRGEDTKMKYR